MTAPLYRTSLRQASPEELERRNRAEQRAHARKFEPADRAVARIQKAKNPSLERLLSWIRHPDERVVLALLERERQLNLRDQLPADERPSEASHPVISLGDELSWRAAKDASEEGVSWTPVLDKLHALQPNQSRTVYRRGRRGGRYQNVNWFPSGDRREHLSKLIEKLRSLPPAERAQAEAEVREHFPAAHPNLVRTVFGVEDREAVNRARGEGGEVLEFLDNPFLDASQGRILLESLVHPITLSDDPRTLFWDTLYRMIGELLDRFPELARDPLAGTLREELARHLEAWHHDPPQEVDDIQAFWSASALAARFQSRAETLDLTRRYGASGAFRACSQVLTAGRARFLADALERGGCSLSELSQALDVLDATSAEAVRTEVSRNATELPNDLVLLLLPLAENHALTFSSRDFSDPERFVRRLLESAGPGRRGSALSRLRERAQPSDWVMDSAIRVLSQRPDLLGGLSSEDLAPGLTSRSTQVREATYLLLSSVESQSREDSVPEASSPHLASRPRRGS